MRGQYCHLDGEPHAAQHLARVHDPQELVLRRGLMEHHYHTGCFFFFGFSQGAVKQLFLGVLSSIYYFLNSKMWAHFHFGTFEPQE